MKATGSGKGNLFLLTVPTAQIAAGDFSDYRGTNGSAGADL